MPKKNINQTLQKLIMVKLYLIKPPTPKNFHTFMKTFIYEIA